MHAMVCVSFFLCLPKLWIAGDVSTQIIFLWLLCAFKTISISYIFSFFSLYICFSFAFVWKFLWQKTHKIYTPTVFARIALKVSFPFSFFCRQSKRWCHSCIWKILYKNFRTKQHVDCDDAFFDKHSYV